MANTISLRRRIKTAQNISKTTRAMQMIAASKLKKAQDAVLASRPYVTKLTEVAENLTPSKFTEQSEEIHPYLNSAKTGRVLYVVIGPDKGLCGALVTNLIREYLKYKNDNASLFITVGKKIEGPVSSTSKNLLASFACGTTLPSFDKVHAIVKIIDEYFLGKKVDSVKILTSHFNSVFSQVPNLIDLLPVNLEGKTSSSKLIEPSQKEILPALLKRYVEMVIFQQLLELYASFQAAQMMAMQNATDNAKEIVSALRLLYNKARQERITKEILDISSATVAMEEKV